MTLSQNREGVEDQGKERGRKGGGRGDVMWLGMAPVSKPKKAKERSRKAERRKTILGF